MRLEKYIRQFPGFPREDILFHDISPLLADAGAFRESIALLAKRIGPWAPDILAGVEARGFVFASALALHMGTGMVMVRKEGKLPGETVREEYSLEYGAAILEAQADAVRPGARVVVVDDLLATGGTFQAAVSLMRGLGATVPGVACVLEMPGLNGRAALDVAAVSLLKIVGDRAVMAGND